MTTVRYLKEVCPEASLYRKDARRRPDGSTAGRGADGYGRKITTDYMARIGRYHHRVYSICISNAASLYVLVKGEMLFLRDGDCLELFASG